MEQYAKTLTADVNNVDTTNHWNERLLAGGKYSDSSFKGEDRFGNYHYSTSEEGLTKIINKNNALSDKANEVNQNRSKIVN